jgi:hypothetical protein
MTPSHEWSVQFQVIQSIIMAAWIMISKESVVT